MDISFTLCLCVCLFVCTVTDFSAEDKASGVKFRRAVYRHPRQGISHFVNFAAHKPKIVAIYRAKWNRHVWI